MAKTIDAIAAINPELSITIIKEPGKPEVIEWGDATPIPQEEIEAKKYELDLQTAHLDDRDGKYPSPQEQFDMIWHDINSNFLLRLLFGRSKWFSSIKKVKEKYPKYI